MVLPVLARSLRVPATDLALPIMGWAPAEDRRTKKPGQLCGTAFTIGGGAGGRSSEHIQ
jgi:hypothetical protein